MEYIIKVKNKCQSGEFIVLDETPVINPKNRKNELWSTYNINTKEGYLIQIHVEGDNLEEFDRYDVKILLMLYNCRKDGAKEWREEKWERLDLVMEWPLKKIFISLNNIIYLKQLKKNIYFKF